jgi:hypothetical protein
LFQQRNVHLVIEKTVHFQYVAGLDDPVAPDAFLQKIHSCTSAFSLVYHKLQQLSPLEKIIVKNINNNDNHY